MKRGQFIAKGLVQCNKKLTFEAVEEKDLESLSP